MPLLAVAVVAGVEVQRWILAPTAIDAAQVRERIAREELATARAHLDSAQRAEVAARSEKDVAQETVAKVRIELAEAKRGAQAELGTHGQDLIKGRDASRPTTEALQKAQEERDAAVVVAVELRRSLDALTDRDATAAQVARLTTEVRRLSEENATLRELAARIKGEEGDTGKALMRAMDDLARLKAESKPQADSHSAAPAAAPPTILEIFKDLPFTRNANGTYSYDTADVLARLSALPGTELDVTDLLRGPQAGNLHEIVYAIVVREALDKLAASSGTFPGMFDSLDRYDRKALVETLAKILEDPETPYSTRRLACEAIAAKGRTDTLVFMPEVLRRIAGNSGDSLRKKAIATMAQLGDRTLLGAEIATVEKEYKERRSGAESPKEVNEVDARYHSELMSLYDDVSPVDFIRHSLGYIAAKEALGDRALGTAYYNLACYYCRVGKIAEAFTALETSCDRGYSDWAWLEVDGDMAPLRADRSRFDGLIEKYKQRNTGTESR